MSVSAAWTLLPYPTLHDNGQLIDGSIIPVSEVCRGCRWRPCADSGAAPGAVEVCRFGMHYVRTSKDVQIVGVVVTDFPSTTKTSRKRRRTEKGSLVRRADLERVVDAAQNLDTQAASGLERERQETVREYLSSDEPLPAILDGLRKEISSSLGQSHDFLQLLKQIRANITSIFAERYPGLPVHEAAERVEAEGAIFFATELMLGKLDANLFLDEPNRAFADEATFSIHGLTTKYFHIYRHQASQKGVDLRTAGECYARVRYNSNAVGAVIQAMLDNCVKYAPAGSKADILLAEQGDTVRLRFESLGPKIEGEEKKQIFLPGFRAAAAKGSGASGIGFGLAAAKSVSDALQLEISVSQAAEQDSRFPHHYKTEFAINLRIATERASVSGGSKERRRRDR